jgi:hypothetical protein
MVTVTTGSASAKVLGAAEYAETESIRIVRASVLSCCNNVLEPCCFWANIGNPFCRASSNCVDVNFESLREKPGNSTLTRDAGETTGSCHMAFAKCDNSIRIGSFGPDSKSSSGIVSRVVRMAGMEKRIYKKKLDADPPIIAKREIVTR